MSQDEAALRPHLAFIQRFTPLAWIFAVINCLLFGYGMLQGLSWNGSSQRSGEVLIDLGARFTPLIDLHGEWWRLFTAMWLHVNVLHLVSNLIVLVIIGSEVESFLGSNVFGWIYLGSGLSGNIVSYSISPIDQPAVGSSGALMGVVGALAVFDVLAYDAVGPALRRQLSSILMLVAATVLLGLMDTNIDQAAHIGGLIGGLVFGFILVPRLTFDDHQINARKRSPWRWVVACAVVVFWLLAAVGIHQQHINDPIIRPQLEQFSSHGAFNQASEVAG